MSFGAFSHQAFPCTEQQILPAQDNRIEFAVQTAGILLAQAHLYIHTQNVFHSFLHKVRHAQTNCMCAHTSVYQYIDNYMHIHPFLHAQCCEAEMRRRVALIPVGPSECALLLPSGSGGTAGYDVDAKYRHCCEGCLTQKHWGDEL